MGRVYASREDTGKRVLVELQCDGADCSATLKPGPAVAHSGWMKGGTSCTFGHPECRTEKLYCPDCWPNYEHLYSPGGAGWCSGGSNG